MLRKELDKYRSHLGKGLITGVGHGLITAIGQDQEYNLLTICNLGEDITKRSDKIIANDDINRIIEMSELVSKGYDPDLSNKICKYIGEIRILANCSQ